MNEKNKKIELVSACAAGAVTAIAGLTGIPSVALAGAIVGPVLERQIGECAEWFLGTLQGKKIYYSINAISDNIVANKQQGKELREDGFFQPVDNKELGIKESPASKLLEGSLLKAKEEYESKKLKFISFLTANIFFAPDISVSKAFVLLEIISKLSYRQLCGLSLFYQKTILPVGAWESRLKASQALYDYYDLAFELISLKDYFLIEQNMPFGGMGMGIRDYRITALGRELFIVANLTSIDENDIKELSDKVTFITNNLKYNK